jgi:hypothetical protein
MARVPLPTALPARAKEDVRLLIKYSDRLAAVMDIADQQKPSITVESLAKNISKDVRIPTKDLIGLFSGLRNVAYFQSHTSDEDPIRELVKLALAKEKQENLDEVITNITKGIERYSPESSVAISFKAQKLTFLRERIFHEAEIITETRPVFNEAGDEILEMIITQTLVCTYSADNKVSNIHLALDGADIANLRKACDRAVVKASALKQALSKDSTWNVVIVEEDTNAKAS